MADTDLRARPSPELTPQLFLLYITTTLQQALLKKSPKNYTAEQKRISALRTNGLFTEFRVRTEFSIKGVSAQNKEFGGPRQLDRAAAGSWQIADGGDPRTTRARVTSVGDLRVRFVVEP